MLSAIVESSHDAIISKSLDGVITSWNAGAGELFGYSAEEAIGQPVMMLIPADRHDEEPSILERIRRGERVDHYETVRVRKDGTRIDISLTVSPIIDTLGNVVGASKIARDITEQKRTQSALAAKERAIKALNAQLSTDLEAMTKMHEISTQLVQVGDFSALLYEILDAAIDVTDADMGNIRLLKDGVLTIAAHRGFDHSFLSYFDAVREGEVACGAAMKNHERVIVEDVRKSPLFVGANLDTMLEANARALQSTPLVSRSGRMLGMFSTHYHVPRRPTTRELKMLDLLARQAADFIERHQGEEALRESEKRLSTFLAQLPVGAGAVDLKGRWVVSNERIRKFMPVALPSFDPARIERWQAFDALGNPLNPRDWPGARALRGETDGLQAEAAFAADDGNTVWLRMTATPLRSENGFMVGAISILEDIDAIKRAEIALRESEDRHRTLISVITDVPCTTDASGSFVKPQEYWAAYTGQSWEQMRGFGWFDAFHPDDRARLRAAWQLACQTGHLYEASGRLWNEETGQYRFFKARATALLNAEGAICEWVGAYTDVDEEKRAKADLETALEERTRQISQAEAALAVAQRIAALGPGPSSSFHK